MKQHVFEPRRLDVEAFAVDGAELSGQWPVSELTRLAAEMVQDVLPELGPVGWHIRGECGSPHGGQPQYWLHLDIQAQAVLQCQRCLGSVDVFIRCSPAIRFVADEAMAAALDEDSDEDVLAVTRTLDLRELAEDELLLALPLVPRHEQCPIAVPLTFGAESIPEEAAPHPFAALAKLKGS